MRVQAAAEASKPIESRFNPARLPVTERSKALVATILKQLLNYEGRCHPRKRQRRKADQARFDRIVLAIVCELAHAALGDPLAWRYISLTKRMSPEEATGAAFMTAERIRIIEWMTAPEMDWLELRGGTKNAFHRQQSAIRASRRFREYMDKHEIEYDDLGLDASLLGDPLVLRAPKVKGKAKNLQIPEGGPATTYREEMLRINAWLAKAEIACEFDQEGAPRDVGDRWLRRIFNDGRLDQGGRLYGGFWQQMSNEARKQDILINGESVASLDYGQCGIHIAYGLAGAKPPPGDLYCVPGLEPYREGVKRVLNAQLSRAGAMKRLPIGTRKHFNRHLSVSEIEGMIVSHHLAIREQFHNGIGLTIQFIDSQVMVRCLLQLIDRGLFGLPVHDGLLVPRSQTKDAELVMKSCFKEITGVEIEVDTQPTVTASILQFPPPIETSVSQEPSLASGGGRG